ncbi:hypothetical protein [Microbacterium sp. GCS4]|uniref:hypothetical protein n=1 Tax=Microbacterium sp. GCS4 TaxID=1692239 RepID=UPI00128EA9EB|nr:hypothetical protein [Microbacterium sp. GCS4]
MDNGSLLAALFGLPFGAGIVLAGLLIILIVPIGVHVVIRIVIDAIVEHREGPGRRELAYQRRYERDRRALDEAGAPR